jgi:hypothetical protein
MLCMDLLLYHLIVTLGIIFILIVGLVLLIAVTTHIDCVIESLISKIFHFNTERNMIVHSKAQIHCNMINDIN